MLETAGWETSQFGLKFLTKLPLPFLNPALQPLHSRVTEIAFVKHAFQDYIIIRHKHWRKKMNVFGSFKKWRNYRRTVNELNALSNRELDDLGIIRGDIPFVARNTR